MHLFGSAGSGKSRFEAQREIVLSFDWQRKRRRTLVIRKVASTLKDSVYTELTTVIAEWNLGVYFTCLKSPLSITNNVTGVQMIFKGLDDPEKIKSVSKVDRVWIEEATELESRDELDQIRLRLRGYKSVQITLSYNPIDEHHWLNTEIHQHRPNEHRIFKTTYRDNVKMLSADPNYADAIERMRETNPNYYRVYGLGEWGKVVEGLIYPEYSTIPMFPRLAPYEADSPLDVHAYGLDFGFSDPHALVALHLRDNMPKKDLIAQELLYESKLDATGLVKRLGELNIRKDVPIIADSARPEMISALWDAGYDCRPCQKGAGSVLSGINKIRDYNLLIAAGSKNIFRELQNYTKRQVQGKWTEEPSPNQVDHCCDAIRYGEQAVGGSGVWAV